MALLSSVNAAALLFSSAAGLSAALIAWVISRAVVAVPGENRSYKDAPPVGFRLLWRPIRWTSHYLEPHLPQKMRNRLEVRLRQAGMEYSLSPAEFVAGRLLFAAVLSAGATVVLPTFELAWGTTLQLTLFFALCGWAYPAIWLRDRIALRRRELLKVLPFFLDLITLCMEAGLNLQGAMQQAVAKGPESALRDEFQRVLRDIRAGKPRAESLRALAERLDEPSVTTFVSAVIQAENMGMNLAPVLRAQADQRRSERFQRAEKQAMEAPVKMLFPLIAFIFPCTFIILLFPIGMQLMEAGF